MPPSQLLETLQEMRRKIRLLSLAFGAGVAVASAVFLLLLMAALDYLLNLPSVPRFLLALAALAALAWVVQQVILRPLLARFTLRDVASRMERAFPQFDDRLRSTVDFAEQSVPGSDAMKQRVIAEASMLAGQVDLNKALVYTPVWYSASTAAAAVVILLMLALLLPGVYVETAAARLFKPFGDARWPKQTKIALVGDVPQRVPVGQRVPVRIQLEKGDKASARATIYYQYDDGPRQKELMTRGKDGVYTASLDARIDAAASSGTLKVWIESGDDLMQVTPIVVVPRLQIERVEAVITPPAYAGQRTSTVDLSSGPAVMTVGSQVALRVHFNKALDTAVPVRIEPVGEAQVPALQWAMEGSALAVGRMTVSESLQFHIKARDTDGFENSGLEEYQWIVRPDQLPTVQIEVPRTNEDATPVAVVPLQAAAEDDYGIRSLKLVVERLGDKKSWTIDLLRDAAAVEGVNWGRIESPGDRQRLRMNWLWELSQLPDANLQPGDVLEYHLLAQDNYELDGQFHEPVASGKLRISIISQDQFTSKVADELMAVKHRLVELKNAQDRTRTETDKLQRDTAQKEQFDAADRTVAERLANQQSTHASQAKQMAGQLGEVQRKMDNNRSEAAELRQTAKDVQELVDRVAENPMKDASNQISQARDIRPPSRANDQQMQQAMAQRNQTLAQANTRQQEASEQLDRALDRMGSIGSLETAIQTLTSILKEQRELGARSRELMMRNLGKRPEQMKPEDRQEIETLARKQAQLGERTQSEMDKFRTQAKELSRTDEASARAMENAAKTGEQQAVPSKQQQASQNMQQNRQSQTQQAQNSAELGLEQMINELREAEKRKLEELAAKLAELQELVANLIRRQAGHNLDNLLIQGGDVLAKLETDVREQLFDLSHRDPEAPPPAPELGHLSSGQEQTERNTRAIAKQAEGIQDGAAIATNLTNAATEMERAIVGIRDRRLPDAYDPSMVRALDELLKVKQLIDERKDEADSKVESKKREALRERFIAIRDQQDKTINARTKALEERRRDGALGRADEIALQNLGGEQARLAGEVEAIGEDLAALRSIVFTWTNRKIVDLMGEVKEDLAQSRSGRPTQAKQGQVVAQLDMMIDALKQSPPKESPFAGPRGGGGAGGGGGAPGLPSEAELRLLRSLQTVVNEETKQLDVPERDEATIAAVGDRQGEIRELLAELLKNSSGGRITIGPEPDPNVQLPEEADEEDIDTDELMRDLLTGELTDDSVQADMNLVGDRMGRSRQRLAIHHDPGRVTQKIQERILIDIDQLIEASRRQQQQQQQQQQTASQRKERPQENQRQPGQQDQMQQNSQEAARESTDPPPAAVPRTPETEIIERNSEWARDLPPRMRQAVIDGQNEVIIEKYRGLIEPYFRGVAERATQEK